MIAAFDLPGFEEEKQEYEEQDGEEQMLFYDEYEDSVMDELPTHERCFAHSRTFACYQARAEKF